MLGNWYPYLVELVSRGRAGNGFIAAIKLWRCVARVGLKEAKDEIEAFMDKRKPMPDGTEYPDISDEDLAWFKHGVHLQ